MVVINFQNIVYLFVKMIKQMNKALILLLLPPFFSSAHLDLFDSKNGDFINKKTTFQS